MNPTVRNHQHVICKTSRAGFSLVEIMVVVVIMGFLLTVLVVAGAAALKRSKISQTQLVLKTLDSIIDEYHTETGRYFDDLTVVPQNSPPNNVGNFLKEVEDVGDIPKIIGALQNETWSGPSASRTILDAWDNPLFLYNPGSIAGISKRPWFWSAGPDGENDRAATWGNPVGGYDLRSAGGAQ